MNPAKIIIFMVIMGFVFFITDQMVMSNNKFHMESAARTTTKAALLRSVEEGGIRTKHEARIDLNVFYDQFAVYGNVNAGEKAMKNPYTGVYKVERFVPYAAIQMARAMESKTMKYYKNDKTIYRAKHRVVYIWDERYGK